jgi:hypothetical protein
MTEFEKYNDVVTFTLNAMIDLTKVDNNYNFFADLQYYYDSTIRNDNILNKEQFTNLVEEVVKSRQ